MRMAHPVSCAVSCAAILVIIAAGAGCAGSSPTEGLDDSVLGRPTQITLAPDRTTTSPLVSPASASTLPPSSPPGTDEPSATSPTEQAAALCARTGTQNWGTVGSDRLVEASGLVASRTHPGVLWSHNDGGDSPGVFAIGTDGFDIGFHTLDVDGVTDLEDIALGRSGVDEVLYLADIGDNGAERDSVRVYRFPEPDPVTVAPITEFDVLEFTYPDRPHNAETLLVDDANQRLVIVTKEQARDINGQPDRVGRTQPSFIFEGPLDGPLEGDGPIELTAVGSLDTTELETRTVSDSPHPATELGFGGVPTGGDVSPDGALVALRTYEAVWVWPREPGQSVAEAFGNEPCQVTSVPEPQGEAVAFVDDGLVTVGEGVNPPLNRLGK
jgi:hypothetical protein